MIRIVLGLLLIVSVLIQPPNVGSFEVDTHSALTTKAVRSSNLDDFLKMVLGINGGVDEFVAGQRTIQWIEDGSKSEDDGFRFFNHFHNPLRTWDQAGLRILGYSSILWGQNPGQGSAWQNARTGYFEALKATTKDDRDAKFAATFHALGQLVHLPQDAAVPAHTRNDQHAFFEGFERFALEITGTSLFDQLTQSPRRFNPSILSLSQNLLAPIPTARITDTTDPEQAQAVPSAGTNQGMSEYSNANFLSGDTIFKNFTFPRMESIDTNFPLTVNNRRYYTKIADGETNFFLVAEGTFTERLLSLASVDKGFVLDTRVYEDYASLLLPRAVGYSAGLIDYFFRGQLGVEVLSEASFPDLPSGLRVKVSNNTPDEETTNGTVVGIVEVEEGNTKSWIVSEEQELGITREPKEIVLQFSSGNPPPSPEAKLTLMVVYQGPLGFQSGAGEDQAVIVGRAPLKSLNLSPKDPLLVCSSPDPKVEFTATGGLPPYTWSTTKGAITLKGTNNEKATLRPPPNNPAVAGVAYKKIWVNGTPFAEDQCFSHPAICFGLPKCMQIETGYFNCNNQPTLAPGEISFCPLFRVACENRCTKDPIDLGNGPKKYCVNVFGGFACPAAIPPIDLVDLRTQSMIDAGCKPCAAEMQDTEVTLKDAAGTEVSTTVTAQ